MTEETFETMRDEAYQLPWIRRGVPEETFLSLERDLIKRQYWPILIYGYDPRFMNNPRTIEAIREGIRKIEPYMEQVFEGKRPKKGIYSSALTAIVSKEDDTSLLEALSEETGGINIVKIPEEIRKGHIVFGHSGFAKWDYSRDTTYKPEKNQGIPFRSLDDYTYSPMLPFWNAKMFYPLFVPFSLMRGVPKIRRALRKHT
jgi:hypothetical protein